MRKSPTILSTTRSFYARIKVLQEKGKELATVELPYWRSNYKITDIKARTIHSDGTVIPLTGKPEDLLVVKENRVKATVAGNRKVFTLPSVEVGSILEYTYQIRDDDDHVLLSALGDSAPLLRPQGALLLHALQGIPARGRITSPVTIWSMSMEILSTLSSGGYSFLPGVDREVRCRWTFQP